MLCTIIIGYILLANINLHSNQTITFKHPSMFEVDKAECENETEKNFDKAIRIPQEIIRSDKKKTRKDNKYIIDRSEDITIKLAERVVVSENNRYGINQNIKPNIVFDRTYSIEDDLEKSRVKIKNERTKNKEENWKLYCKGICSKRNLIKYTTYIFCVLTMTTVLYFIYHY